MLKHIYDNGSIILGEIDRVIEYLYNNMEATSDTEEETYTIIQDLKELQENKKNYIVAINYDVGMGYTIDYWDKTDKKL